MQAYRFSDNQSDEAIKSCCAAVYESDWSRLLLGDSFHPGGLELTTTLGKRLGLTPDHHLLDLASGRGSSAMHLARHFGCHVTGIDYGTGLVEQARAAAEREGLAAQVRFERGDAERLHFPDQSFDAVICECAFCTFPDKAGAAAEIFRVLKPAGRLGISDLTRQAELPSELNQLLAWVACIADARPIEEYTGYLASAGFVIDEIQTHDTALHQTVRSMRSRLLGAELLVKLKKIELAGANFEQARKIARSAETAVRQGKLGYALILATRFQGKEAPVLNGR